MKFEISYISREENVRTDLLDRLASTKGPGLNRMVIQETLEAPSIKIEEAMMLENTWGWLVPIIQYLTQYKLPEEGTEA